MGNDYEVTAAIHREAVARRQPGPRTLSTRGPRVLGVHQGGPQGEAGRGRGGPLRVFSDRACDQNSSDA